MCKTSLICDVFVLSDKYNEKRIYIIWNCSNLNHNFFLKYRFSVMILSFRTDRPEQTVQTQIRLLLKEQSDQGLRFCHSVCIFKTHFSLVKQFISNFRIITTIFEDVQICMIITVKQTKLFHFHKFCETKTDTDYIAPNHRHTLEDCRCKLDQYRKFWDLSYVLNSMFYRIWGIKEVSVLQNM